MCTIIYKLALYTIMLCPNDQMPGWNVSNGTHSGAAANATKNASAPATNSSYKNAGESATANGSALNLTAPSNLTAPLNLSAPLNLTALSNLTAPLNLSLALNLTAPSNLTVPLNRSSVRNNSSPHERNTSDVMVSPSPSSDCGPCAARGPGEAPAAPVVLRAPRVNGTESNNTENTTSSQDVYRGGNRKVTQDLSWLHALWALVPMLALLCYGVARRHWCARIRVGFWHKRYGSRSKSWPACEPSAHPARLPRSKSANFDTVVL